MFLRHESFETSLVSEEIALALLHAVVERATRCRASAAIITSRYEYLSFCKLVQEFKEAYDLALGILAGCFLYVGGSLLPRIELLEKRPPTGRSNSQSEQTTPRLRTSHPAPQPAPSSRQIIASSSSLSQANPSERCNAGNPLHPPLPDRISSRPTIVSTTLRLPSQFLVMVAVSLWPRREA
jgi:hypothetical protein